MPIFDAVSRARAALRDFEPYDPAFTPCEVNLSANENSYPLPAAYNEALRRAMSTVPLNRYPDPMANDLRDAIAARHGVSRENVIVGNGGDELLFNLLFCFGGPGHTLVTCPPDFSEYALFAQMTETPHRQIWRDSSSYAIDADALLGAAQDAALVVLTSPNNPTGDALDHTLLRHLLDSSEALVLVDEAYVEFASAGASIESWVLEHPRLIVLRTFSKAFGLAGLRLGYLLANPAVVNMLGAIRQIYSVDVVAQAVGLAAIQNRDLLAPIITQVGAERERLAAALVALGGVQVWPSVANFLLVRVPDAARVRACLRDEYSILVRDFSAAPGLEGCLRITVGTPEENDRVIAALSALVKGE